MVIEPGILNYKHLLFVIIPFINDIANIFLQELEEKKKKNLIYI